jgi:hypothetical protein
VDGDETSGYRSSISICSASSGSQTGMESGSNRTKKRRHRRARRRNGPAAWPWWPGKEHLLPRLSCGGAHGADAGLHLRLRGRRGGAGTLGVRRCGPDDYDD